MSANVVIVALRARVAGHAALVARGAFGFANRLEIAGELVRVVAVEL